MPHSSLTRINVPLSYSYYLDICEKNNGVHIKGKLGLIMRILSIGFPKLAYFHLLTHALFKMNETQEFVIEIYLKKNTKDETNN